MQPATHLAAAIRSSVLFVCSAESSVSSLPLREQHLFHDYASMTICKCISVHVIIMHVPF